jgi:NADH-quinone oxidoreductase subunit C
VTDEKQNGQAPEASSPSQQPEPKEAPAAAAPVGSGTAQDVQREEQPVAPKKPERGTAAPAAGGAAARPRKPAAPPDPRVEAAKQKAEEIRQVIVEALGDDAVEETGAAHVVPMLRIRREKWRDAVALLRDHPAWRLNYLECMAGTDYPDYIEVVVYIQSTSLGHFVCLKTRTPRDNAEVPSLVPVHPGTNWEEREIYDLLGVRFTDHPDLRRIMLWEGFEGHPLRKDYDAWASGGNKTWR